MVAGGTHGKLSRSGNVVLQGHLKKRGGFHSAFQRRFCVLAGSTVYYFKSEKDNEPVGRIELNGYTLSNANGESAYCFKMTPNSTTAKQGGRTWVLQADNRDQLVAWATAIEKAFVGQFDDDQAIVAKQNFTTFQVPLQSFNMLVQVLIGGEESKRLTLPYEMVRYRRFGELKQLFYDDAVAKNLISKSASPQYYLQVLDTELVVSDGATLALDDFLAPETEEHWNQNKHSKKPRFAIRFTLNRVTGAEKASFFEDGQAWNRHARQTGGWLSKKSPSLFGGWSSRFFVVRDAGMLYYNKEVDSTKQISDLSPQGIIPINPMTNVEQSSSRMKYENCFDVQVGDRLFQMQAPDYSSMLAWLYAVGENKRASKDKKDKPPPPEEELLHIFYSLMDTVELDSSARSELVSLTNSEKWSWVQEIKSEQQNKALKFGTAEAKALKNAAEGIVISLVELTKMSPEQAEEEGVDRVRAVRLEVSTQGNGWVAQFCKAKGPAILMNLANREVRKVKNPSYGYADEELVEEIALCLKYLMESEVGLEALLHTSELVKLLLRAIETIEQCQQLCMELLFAICWYRREDRDQKGHTMVVDATTTLAERYSIYVQVMEQTLVPPAMDDEDEDEDGEGVNENDPSDLDIGLLTVSLLLINAICNTSHSVETRMSIRTEFIHSNVLQVMDHIKEIFPLETAGDMQAEVEVLHRQIADFQAEMKKDEQFVLSQHPSSHLGARSTETIDAICLHLQGQPELTMFTNILEYVAMIPSDAAHTMWATVEHMVYQVVIKNQAPKADFELNHTNKSITESLADSSGR